MTVFALVVALALAVAGTIVRLYQRMTGRCFIESVGSKLLTQAESEAKPWMRAMRNWHATIAKSGVPNRPRIGGPKIFPSTKPKFLESSLYGYISRPPHQADK
jgi:hypothetical protein